MTHDIPSDSIIIKKDEHEYLRWCEMKMQYYEKMVNELKKENHKLKKENDTKTKP